MTHSFKDYYRRHYYTKPCPSDRRRWPTSGYYAVAVDLLDPPHTYGPYISLDVMMHTIPRDIAFIYYWQPVDGPRQKLNSRVVMRW